MLNPIEPDAPSSTAAPASDRTVVYVEDEPLNALIMQEIFRRLPGWDLRLTTTAEEGLRLVGACRPALMLVDMNLPDMNGLDLIRVLRSEPETCNLRVVVVSANAMPDDVDRALRSGADEYWTKPIRPVRMLEELTRVLDGL